MPYVPEKDRRDLERLIAPLHDKILYLAKQDSASCGVECGAWGYMRHVAIRVLTESGLNAAEQYQGKRGMRYWLIVDQAGIALNIAFELFDRVYAECGETMMTENVVLEPKPEEYPLPDDTRELDREIDALLSQIAENAGPKGYNYDGAYCGLVNYSMTELMPRVLKGVRDAQNSRFGWGDAKEIIEFWIDVARELYNPLVARPYEDAQRRPDKNGDVRVYGEMLEWIKG